VRKPKKPKPRGVRAKKLTDWRQIANDYAWQLIEADKFIFVLAHSLERANERLETVEKWNDDRLSELQSRDASIKALNHILDVQRRELNASESALQSYVASFDEYRQETDAEIRKLTAFRDLVQGLAERDLAGNLHIMRKDIDLLQ
jgi:hypothetical protein